MTRTTYSFSKYFMIKDVNETFTKYFFGTTDFLFMFFFAMGLFLIGKWGDKFNKRYYLVISGIFVCLTEFGIS